MKTQRVAMHRVLSQLGVVRKKDGNRLGLRKRLAAMNPAQRAELEARFGRIRLGGAS